MQQADTAPITGASATISGNSADLTGCHRAISGQNTRRSILTGLALLPIAAAIVPAKAAALDGTWQRALATFDAAKAANERFWVEVELPAIRALEAMEGPGLVFTVDRPGQQPLHFRVDPSQPDPYRDEPWAPLREASAAHRARYDAWVVSKEKEEARLKIDWINRESERLGDAAFDAENIVMATPAPHVAALAVKLEMLLGDDDRVPATDQIGHVLRDAHRLGGQA